jgi:hypothetical protein
MTISDFLNGVTADVSADRAAERDGQARADRLAATLVGRHATRHRCILVGCRHRNHQRDERYRQRLLDELGLPDEGAKPADYDEYIPWHSVSRSEGQTMMGKPPGRG